nr:unnamed protein product [Callosobruchus analis]
MNSMNMITMRTLVILSTEDCFCQPAQTSPIRMNRRKKMKCDYKPQVLSQVLDTIASMRDSNGSPPQKIMQRLMAAHKIPAKKVELVVKKALR